MDRNRIEGGKQEPKGNTKETLGNPSQRPEGQHEKSASKQNENGRQEDRQRREQPHH